MASASRPDSSGKFEIESADDFVTTTQMSVTSATFTGLLSGGATTADVGAVRVEIYRVFPNDSDTTRTSGPPTFSTTLVPTRVNSPSDVELGDRSTIAGNLSYTTTLLSPSFTALNSIQPGGIHAVPGQTTGGDGPVTGLEVQFNVAFADPLTLAAGHYFFVPQVEVADPVGNFFWLSAARPNLSFPSGFTDLQSWTRDGVIDPDWLRIGTDIVGGTTPPTFNAAFSLDGVETPLPAALPMFMGGAGLIALLARRRKQKTLESK